jgi:hypothetical protein
MADNKNLTVWQKLGILFGPDKSPILNQSKSYQIDSKELLKTKSKEDYNTEKLQAQQSLYLKNQWEKVDNTLYQQAVFYETTRIASYTDFESMEFFPEISAALDILMEESTTQDSKGKVLQIYSESDRVKRVLNDLFFNRLDIHTTLPMWTRNTVKYGDNFVFLDIDDKEGIVNCKQLPNIEIERHEGDVYNSINGVIDVERNKKKGDDLKFVWKNREFEFNSWQIAHFRLLGDDRRLPYGTSVLEKARRIYKQLMLSEDAMLIYRITRAPERRIFKIFVGNIDDKDVEPYVQQIANKFKRTPVVDPKTGQIDLRYNQMSNDQDFFIPVRDPAAGSPIETLPGACISLDTRIPLLDGRTLTLNEIIGEWDNGNRNLWVYSCNPKTGEFVPGMITWAGVTRKNTDVMKITLDNGEEIIATPDHKFLHREGYKIECKDLEVGMSLMPLYRKNEVKYKKNGYEKDYEMVFDHSINDWVWTHKKVSNFHKDNLSKEHIFNESKSNLNKNTIHHVDFNRFNNTPTNLVFMNFSDHLELHSKNTHIMREAFIKKYNENPTFKEKVKTNLNKGREIFHNKRNSNPEYKEQIRTKQKESINKFFDSLSMEELKQWCERINNPTTKAKTTEKLLKWCENPDNLKLKGQLISAVKSTPEAKEKISKMSKSFWERPGYKESVFNKKQTLTFSDKLYNMFVNEFEKHLRADITLNILNNNSEFMSEFTLINGGIRSSLTNLDTFTHNHLEKMVKQKGFKNFREWKQNEVTKRGFINIRQWQYYVDKEKGKYGDKNNGKSINQFYNHKIVKIEHLEERIDTGTITVDGNEIYHNYHTFALESGVYIFNSNLSEIADIEYLQKKLFAALRIPKPFLGFESAVGDGKNLALQDIRFTRTVNRIQQSMLQELNKIAIIHLFILGLDEELNNFTLALNNPSTQAEVLRTEHLQAKMQLYKDSVSDAGNGFAAMSMTRAKKEILNFSNEEIRLDIEQQRLEKAAAAELANTANVIKKTGMFDKVDRLYGETTPAPVAEGGEVIPPAPTEGGLESPEMGGGIETTPPETESTPPTTESVNRNVENLLVERKEILSKTYETKKERYKDNYLNKLMESLENNEKVKLIVNENDENVSDLNKKYNDEIKNMTNNIDNLLK